METLEKYLNIFFLFEENLHKKSIWHKKQPKVLDKVSYFVRRNFTK